MGASINGITVRSSNFTAVIEEFTPNTYVMVVFSDMKVQQGAIAFNIGVARKFFESSSGSETEKLQMNWKH